MFSDKLFSHKYDIDLIIRALCGEEKTAYTLNTDKGILIEESPEGVFKTEVLDNSLSKTAYTARKEENGTKLFKIDPLPNSFISELILKSGVSKLTDNQKDETKTLLTACEKTENLPTHFHKGVIGGWLREQVKKEALEWLDLNGLIPPSMGHITDVSMYDTKNPVKIILEEN